MKMDTAAQREGTFLNRWGAIIILAVLFFGSWGGQFITQLQTFRDEQIAHGQIFAINEFIPEFWSSTLENWQSEWLQLAMQGLLISGFSTYIFRKQNEEHYRTQQMIGGLQKQIDQLVKAHERGRS